MPDLALDDITLHYEIDGAGPPLLMLAGMFSDSASWTPVIQPLAANFTLIRPDNRLTGRTLPELAPAGPRIYAADALALLDHLGIDRAHVLGHSMGGLIGMELAHAAPDRVASLILAGITPDRSPRLIPWFDAILETRATGPRGLWLKLLLCWLMRGEFYAQPGALDVTVEAGLAYPYAQSLPAMRAQMEALRSYVPSEASSGLRVPTHAILAVEDMFVNADSARAALSAIPGLDVTLLQEAGHSMHWDQPLAFAQAVIQAAARVPAPT